MASELDLDALLRYATANVTGFPPSPSNFTFSKDPECRSNATFLRKKQPGKLLQSARAVEREFQCLRDMYGEGQRVCLVLLGLG